MGYVVRVPLHVSGIWIPVLRENDVRGSGSLGAGLNLSLYLVVRDYSVGDRCRIRVNGREVLVDHARYICSRTGVELRVNMESPVDLGRGYAVSAASLLAYSILSGLLKGSGFLEEYASYAHEAEIIYRTGLGDVLAIYYGGVEVRVKPGSPGIGVVKHIVVKEKPCILACVLPGGENTPSMLKRITSEIYSYGKRLLEELIENPTLESFFDKARLFTRMIFNYKEIDELLRNRNGLINYYRKKQALIIWVEREYINDLIEYLTENKLYCIETSIDLRGIINEYFTQT
ncbi:MAG: pantothenate kinase [Desulfurococcales archaeon ex4484_58]|nr:MAG: pantothenate kinase [Desulfurococcales archaeon ex4484_58]